MAIEPDEEDREDLIIEDAEADQPEPDEAEADEGHADEPDEGETPDEDDEIEISFGDDEPTTAQPEDSPVIRKMREELRKRDKELAELRRQNAPKPVELGPRPTLEACDYDEEKFAAETEAWIGRKATADAEAQKQRQQQETAQQAWNDELAGYERKKTALKARNFDVAEEAVLAGLTPAQQATIIQAADDSAKVVYALGLHPGKLAELAKISNLVKFTAAVVKLEGSLKVTSKRNAPTPDRSVRGSAPFTATNSKTDAHLEKLEREADRTGDRSKIHAYRMEQREKERARKK